MVDYAQPCTRIVFGEELEMELELAKEAARRPPEAEAEVEQV